MNGENLYPLGGGLGLVAVMKPPCWQFQTLVDGMALAGDDGYRFANHLLEALCQCTESVILRPASSPCGGLCATWDLTGDDTLDVLLARRPRPGEGPATVPLRASAFRITVAGRFVGGGITDEPYAGGMRDVLFNEVLRRRVLRDGYDLLEEAPQRSRTGRGNAGCPELAAGFVQLGVAYSPVPVATDWRPSGAA